MKISNLNMTFDYSSPSEQELEWNVSTRAQSVRISILSSDRIVVGKVLSVAGSNKKGVSIFFNTIECDVSPRMIGKIVRVYSRLITVLDLGGSNSATPPRNTSTSPHEMDGPSPPIFSPAVSATDLNFLILTRKKFNTTPQLKRSASSASNLNHENSSILSTGSGAAVYRDVRNWRCVERMMVSGKVLMSFHVERVHVCTRMDLELVINKVKITSKISSIGSPFTSFNCDSISVNDNITTGSGMRIWIDGDLSSNQSRVFCLIPPIAIRFDPKFAGTVEKYFLDIADALKGLRSYGSSSARKFVEVLQVSSLQLELHAKEMLGVLALDKAMINLNRSSVYKSNGLVDAMNSLVSQYKVDVAGQWLSLLVRLDVSIGRPVTTARKLIGGISEYFTKGNDDDQN